MWLPVVYCPFFIPGRSERWLTCGFSCCGLPESGFPVGVMDWGCVAGVVPPSVERCGWSCKWTAPQVPWEEVLCDCTNRCFLSSQACLALPSYLHHRFCLFACLIPHSCLILSPGQSSRRERVRASCVSPLNWPRFKERVVAATQWLFSGFLTFLLIKKRVCDPLDICSH